MNIRPVVLTTLLALPLLATAQSGASPFGKTSSGKINAIGQWQKLPEPVRESITTELSTLTEQERVELLATVPALGTLPPEQLQDIVTVVAQDVPLPPSGVLDQAHTGVSNASMSVQQAGGAYNYVAHAQSYQAGITGTLTRVKLQVRGAGDVLVEIRDYNGNVGSTVLGSGTLSLPPDGMAAAPQLVEVTMSAASQTAGNRYAIAVTPISPGAVLEWSGIHYDGNPSMGYTAGLFFSRIYLDASGAMSPWHASAGMDAIFETYVQPAQ